MSARVPAGGYGFLTTQLLYVAAKLGVADVLADGPLTGAEVAGVVGADPDLLTRVLRGLALEEVLEERDGGRFALTEVGACLRSDVAGSMRGPVVVRGELYYQAAAGMLAAVGHGGTAFEQVYGDRFFAYLARHPEQEAVFQGSMSGRAEQEAGDVVAAYDFSGLGRLVDVGGGHGILLGRRSGRPRGCGRCWWTSRRWWSRPADGWRPRGSPGAASWSRATSSAPSRPGPTPISSRGCSTTGPTTTPAAC